jgi:hypothetical protein
MTLVPSPELVMVKVPAVATGVYAYEPQLAGPEGMDAMKGPATWPCALVAAEVSSLRAVGMVPMWAE